MTHDLDTLRGLVARHVEAPLESYLRAQAQERATRPYSLSAWNVGKCQRALWYGLHGAVQEPMNPRAVAVMSFGNLIEDAEIKLLEAAGLHLVRTDESRDTFDLPPIGRGRPDFLVEAGGQMFVVDVKSMSNFAFERAQEGKADLEYVTQLEFYMRGLSLPGILWCVRKETSHRVPLVFVSNDERWQKMVRNAEAARGERCPDRPYAARSECAGVSEGKCVGGKTPGRGQPHSSCEGSGQATVKLSDGRKATGAFLIYPCSYCPFRSTCWPGSEMLISADGQPFYRVHA
jgi:hypothetical protein